MSKAQGKFDFSVHHPFKKKKVRNKTFVSCKRNGFRAFSPNREI